MRLYAAGFNAWKQLEFLPLENSIEESNDILAFQKVLSDKLIEVQYASLTCTIVNTSAELQYAGFVDESIECGLKEGVLSSTAAIAGNGCVAIYDGHSVITQHAPQLGSTEVRREEFTGMYDIVQLVAYETGFVALSRDGKVWTWGDERYSATLGRETTISSPAGSPGFVEDLEDLPSGKIRKIAAAGYTVIALTEGNDLYAWGGHPARQPILQTLSGNPSPVDVEENDILDCSIGETHMLVLTTRGDVYTIGENSNGQLGLLLRRTADWVKVPLPPQGEVVVGVRAGQRSSFIVTKNAHPV
ncbi:regulator of chromosome condensation 1/beta-lactamase-inhibitor protein II [Xylaria digitata]|nr:regulator of chromosome condensation 1/beta-lactamase-inhibitor protein II [Xylaria digitata]